MIEDIGASPGPIYLVGRELEKQRRKVNLIKVFEITLGSILHVVTRIEDILAGTGPSYPVRRNWRRRGEKLI